MLPYGGGGFLMKDILASYNKCHTKVCVGKSDDQLA